VKVGRSHTAKGRLKVAKPSTLSAPQKSSAITKGISLHFPNVKELRFEVTFTAHGRISKQ